VFLAASAFAAIIPMMSYLFIIWWVDRYDREPFRHVLKNYLWGALGAIIFAIVWSSIISAFVSVFVNDEVYL